MMDIILLGVSQGWALNWSEVSLIL